MADTDESRAGDAAEAFEHLTHDVSVFHHTVEELLEAIQLEEPPNYSSTLGKSPWVSDRSGSGSSSAVDQIENWCRPIAKKSTPCCVLATVMIRTSS
jgi:hypothetical protein